MNDVPDKIHLYAEETCLYKVISRNFLNRGQSDVIGVIIMVAVIISVGTVIGGFYVTQLTDISPNPAATISYDEYYLTDASASPPYAVEVEASKMERADKLFVYHEGSQVGTITSVGGTVEVREIEDKERIRVIAVYEGNRQFISEYTFDEDKFLQQEAS